MTEEINKILLAMKDSTDISGDISDFVVCTNKCAKAKHRVFSYGRFFSGLTDLKAVLDEPRCSTCARLLAKTTGLPTFRRLSYTKEKERAQTHYYITCDSVVTESLKRSKLNTVQIEKSEAIYLLFSLALLATSYD